MEKVTVDQIGIEAHKRYAVDQETLDTVYITDSSMIPRHLEMAGTSSIYSSKWEELFEVHLKNIPWAAFSPPPKYYVQRNRFFSHALIPGILWSNDEEQDEDEGHEEERKKQNETLKTLMETIAVRRIKENETALLNLVESVKILNSLLKEINSRKIQYQKG